MGTIQHARRGVSAGTTGLRLPYHLRSRNHSHWRYRGQAGPSARADSWYYPVLIHCSLPGNVSNICLNIQCVHTGLLGTGITCCASGLVSAGSHRDGAFFVGAACRLADKSNFKLLFFRVTFFKYIVSGISSLHRYVMQ